MCHFKVLCAVKYDGVEKQPRGKKEIKERGRERERERERSSASLPPGLEQPLMS
jgi:hypothetical protein